MGLDMFAFTTSLTPTKAVDFPDPETCNELHYWRKHPNLHGWMEKLYRSKGGQDPDFNMAPVLLELTDLAALEKDVLENRLSVTVGFFFGESQACERDRDLAFIAKARDAIAHGQTVYYVAWW
jgi:hypothetical protein